MRPDSSGRNVSQVASTISGVTEIFFARMAAMSVPFSAIPDGISPANQ